MTRRASGSAIALCLVVWAAIVLAQAPQWEADNPLTPLPRPPRGIGSNPTALPDPPTPERVRLGRWLFYDTRLSADGTVACATCHRPEFAFSQPTSVATGIRGQKGHRKAPSLVNLAWAPGGGFFWDGRAPSLEAQALEAIGNPTEMDSPPAQLAQRVGAIRGYLPYFRQAFGTEEVTPERIAGAIADYVRTRYSGNSRWERWMDENESSSRKFKMGEQLFTGKAGCVRCHMGQNFSDGSFHNTGIGWNVASHQFSDVGRFGVTHRREDMGAFKTPSLREVDKRAPYMHDGSMATLGDVVLHYNRGGTPNPYLDEKITPLNLTNAEIDVLIDFLTSLTGDGYQDAPPRSFPH